MTDLDPKMKDIVYGLNRLGLNTQFSCQGNHQNGEIGIAYISFCAGVTLPAPLIQYIKDQNWQIDLDSPNTRQMTYSIHSVDAHFPEDLRELERRNSEFISGWKAYVHRSLN